MFSSQNGVFWNEPHVWLTMPEKEPRNLESEERR